MRRQVRVACASAVCAGLLASGCGVDHRPVPLSGGYGLPSATQEPAPSSPESSPSSPEPSAAPPAVGATPTTTTGPLEIRAKVTKYGRILVDGRGMTIYVAARDNADFESTCSGPCTKEWPPLFTNGQVTAGPGVNSAWLGTIGRSDSPIQVEYNGWPLYYSARDTEPGEMKGQRVVSNGTTWYVIDADKGQKVK